MDGGAPYNPRTVEEVFRDFKGRRAGMIKALTTGNLFAPIFFFNSVLLLQNLWKFDEILNFLKFLWFQRSKTFFSSVTLVSVFSLILFLFFLIV
uniref:ALF domain class transcription factor n=1 Tax=Malus domestica TaxID=3750 RepID=D9ZIL4_MALDO|nr:ALF domain class transcription factor [Malus domestica]